MKTFLADIIPSIQRFSKQLDDLTMLTNQHWVSLGDINDSKKVFIFRKNNQLLISENGIVQKGSWDYLGNQSLLIETTSGNYLLKHGFFDENVIALKLDSTNSYAFFINETKFDNELNTIDDIIRFLNNKYLKTGMSREGVSSNKSGSINDEIKYNITSEYESFDIVLGKHIYHNISYGDDFNGVFYKGGDSGRYCYNHLEMGRIYCDNKEDVINQLYYYLLRNQNR